MCNLDNSSIFSPTQNFKLYGKLDGRGPTTKGYCGIMAAAGYIILGGTACLPANEKHHHMRCELYRTDKKFVYYTTCTIRI